MAHRNRHLRRELKEAVLHTRVPEVLEAELKNLSKALRIPVSNIVRAAVEDALSAANLMGDTVQHEVKNAAERLAWLSKRFPAEGASEADAQENPTNRVREMVDEAQQRRVESKRRRLLRGVIGFQPLELARETNCAICGRDMAEREQAFLGVRERRGPQVIVGSECLPNRDSQETEKKDE